MKIELKKENILINKVDICIEPSAGNGSFIEGIKTICMHNKFYDLEPENPEIIKQDYLSFDYSKLDDTMKSGSSQEEKNSKKSIPV